MYRSVVNCSSGFLFAQKKFLRILFGYLNAPGGLRDVTGMATAYPDAFMEVVTYAGSWLIVVNENPQLVMRLEINTEIMPESLSTTSNFTNTTFTNTTVITADKIQLRMAGSVNDSISFF